MTLHDDQPRTGNASRRRRRIAVGAAGLAVALGAGAYAITTQVADHASTTAAPDVPLVATPAGPAPATTVSPAVAVPHPTGSPVSHPVAGARRSAGPGPTRSVDVAQEIRAARAKALRDGFPLRRARTAGPHIESGPVAERTEPRPNGTLRVLTAHYDLSGQRELLWPADGGKPVGDATCTQTFRFANDTRPSTKPTLLLCWRTSPTRSVVTVLVDRGGKPSAAESVRVIDHEWAALG